MLLHPLYPTTATEPPLDADERKSPRPLYLDTGLVNYHAGLQGQIVGLEDLGALLQGRLAEHVVGQELIATDLRTHHKPMFWVREKAGSSAEVDCVVLHAGTVVPVEVKSGKAGTLRSLHELMDRVDHDLAVRLHAGEIKLQDARTAAGKRFRLLDLPLYLVCRLGEYLD